MALRKLAKQVYMQVRHLEWTRQVCKNDDWNRGPLSQLGRDLTAVSPRIPLGDFQMSIAVVIPRDYYRRGPGNRWRTLTKKVKYQRPVVHLLVDGYRRYPGGKFKMRWIIDRSHWAYDVTERTIESNFNTLIMGGVREQLLATNTEDLQDLAKHPSAGRLRLIDEEDKAS